MPDNVIEHAIGNDVSELFSGAISAAIVTILLVKAANKEMATKK